MKNSSYNISKENWEKLRKPMYHKVVLDNNGDAKIYTPNGFFIISADTDPDHHGFWVGFQSHNIEDYEQQLAYFEDVHEEQGEGKEPFSVIKLVTWEESPSDKDQLICIKKVKEEDLENF